MRANEYTDQQLISSIYVLSEHLDDLKDKKFLKTINRCDALVRTLINEEITFLIERIETLSYECEYRGIDPYLK